MPISLVGFAESDGWQRHCYSCGNLLVSFSSNDWAILFIEQEGKIGLVARIASCINCRKKVGIPVQASKDGVPNMSEIIRREIYNSTFADGDKSVFGIIEGVPVSLLSDALGDLPGSN